MDPLRVALIGMGSTRCGAPIIGSLATYFGERVLELALYDADAERLDLYERLARVCFRIHDCTHSLRAAETAEEALEDAARVVVSVGPNCAAKYLRLRKAEAAGRDRTELVAKAVAGMLEGLPEGVPVLSLMPKGVAVPGGPLYRLEWPPAPEPESRGVWGHQVLRWIKGDEYMHAYIRSFEASPLKAWLDDVESAIVYR